MSYKSDRQIALLAYSGRHATLSPSLLSALTCGSTRGSTFASYPPVDPHPPSHPAPSRVSQVDPPPLVEPLEVSLETSGTAEGGDLAADDTAASRRSPRLGTPPGFPPRLSSPPLPSIVVDSSTAEGGAAGGVDSTSADAGGARSRGAEPGGGQKLRSRSQEALSPLQLCEWVALCRANSGGAASRGAEHGGTELRSAEPGGANTGGAEPGVADSAARGPGAGGAGVGGPGAGGAGAGGVGAGGAGGDGAGGAGAGVTGTEGCGAGGAAQPLQQRRFFSP
ncbi:unnamed protein product [Closterium sp. NIES-54]